MVKAEMMEKYELEISSLKRLNEKLYIKAGAGERMQEALWLKDNLLWAE